MGVECVSDPVNYLRVKHRLYGHKCFDIFDICLHIGLFISVVTPKTQKVTHDEHSGVLQVFMHVSDTCTFSSCATIMDRCLLAYRKMWCPKSMCF